MGSGLLGEDVTNLKARNTSGDDWKTPDDFYKSLDDVYHFDFDPCPYQATFNGLESEWGGGKLRQSALHQEAQGGLCNESIG